MRYKYKYYNYIVIYMSAGQQAVDQWYDEIKKYDFSRHSGQGTGRFNHCIRLYR